MEFTKMHGAGNDFIVVDAREWDTDWPLLARYMCDRHFGVGADGIVIAKRSTDADLQMRIFNPDGSEAEMCGNGIRCLTRYAVKQGLLNKQTGTGWKISTNSGTKQVFVLSENSDTTWVKVRMGKPILEPGKVPVSLPDLYSVGDGPVLDYPLDLDGNKLSLAFVSMGNPHAVAVVDSPIDEFPLLTLGPVVENHPIFPHRVNFEVVNVVDRGHLRARVWERGAGATLACGSGACAITVATHLQGLVDDQVELTLPGGILRLSWNGQDDVWMEGPATDIFHGKWELGKNLPIQEC